MLQSSNLLVKVLEEAEDRHMAAAREEGTEQQPDRQRPAAEMKSQNSAEQPPPSVLGPVSPTPGGTTVPLRTPMPHDSH